MAHVKFCKAGHKKENDRNPSPLKDCGQPSVEEGSAAGQSTNTALGFWFRWIRHNSPEEDECV
jgi:hypothetical protein